MLSQFLPKRILSIFAKIAVLGGRWPITVQLLCLALSVILPLIILLVYLKYEKTTEEIAYASKSSLNLAEITAGSTEQFIADHQALMSLVARRVQDHNLVPEECDVLLSDFRDLPRPYSNILIVDTTGQLICSDVPLFPDQSPDFSDRQWFKRAVREQRFLVDVPVIDRLSDKWIIPMAYPLHNAHGEFVGVLEIGFDPFRYQFILDGVSLPPNSVITIVTDTGIVVARTPVLDSLAGKDGHGIEVVDTVLAQSSGYARAKGLDGIERIFGFTSITETGWHVYVGVPTEIVIANEYAGFIRNSLIEAAIVLTALILALYLGRRISHPIRELAQAVHAVKQGQFDTRASIAGPLEVAQVATEFNQMLDARAKDEQALRDSESRLRLVINQLPTMLWTTDTDLRFTSILGKGFLAQNVQPNQLVGQNLVEIFNTADPQFPSIHGHRQALEGQSTVYELDSNGRIYECYVEPLCDDHKHIIGCIGVALDITERKQAEEALRNSEKLFRAMIENSSDGIVLMTADGTITYGTPGTTRISGYSVGPKQTINRIDLIHPDDLERSRNAWTKLLQEPGAISVSEVRVRHINGSWTWVESILHNLLEDPNVRAIVSNYRDITERKQAEDALRRYATRLEIRHEIDEAILAAHSLEEITMAALNRVSDLVTSQEAHITLYDFDENHVTVYARIPHSEPDLITGMQIPMEQLGEMTDILDSLRRGEVLVTDKLTDRMPNSPIIQTWLAGAHHTVIVAPMREHESLIGTLSLSTKSSVQYNAEDIKIVHELADSLAVAIVQIRLFDRVNTGRNRLRKLSQQLIEAQEDASRRIARELHDEVGTNLSALGINLYVLKSEMSDDASKVLETRVNDSLILLDEAQDRIRIVLTDLHPAVLDDYGLEAALHWYAEQFSDRVGVEVDVHSTNLSSRLSSELETVLFRIAQEALTNVAKHAQATHVNITLEQIEGVIRLIVADDGIGFNPSEQHKPNKQGGLGLISMTERAALVEGHLRVESLPGQGTQVLVEVQPSPSDRPA